MFGKNAKFIFAAEIGGYVRKKTLNLSLRQKRKSTMGKLIVLEGIDGSGKSTQFDLLCKRLSSESTPFTHVTFPRYDMPSAAMIKLYLEGKFGNSPDSVNAYAASSFFAADRYASYKEDWGDYYQNGGLVLMDRYTTSNAIHQGAKLTGAERERFFKWLYEYEFELLGLPAPDLVLYMDISSEQASVRISKRQAETGAEKDIHEEDTSFLEMCAECGKHAAEYFKWKVIRCFPDSAERAIQDIHEEVYDEAVRLIAQT
jgi:dTMP kinase